jgi:hypothetical protein
MPPLKGAEGEAATAPAAASPRMLMKWTTATGQPCLCHPGVGAKPLRSGPAPENPPHQMGRRLILPTGPGPSCRAHS